MPTSEAARALFKQGVALLQAKDYQGGYQAFKAAYADSPSPKILGNLGLAAMRLERDGEAVDAYERYLSEAGAVNDKESRQIVEDLVVLKGRMAQVSLTVRPPAATVADERLREGEPPVVNRYVIDDGRLEIGIHHGRHRMTIERAGYEPVVWEFEAKRASVLHKSVEPLAVGSSVEPIAEPAAADDADVSEGGFPSTGFIVVASVTGALAIGTAIVGSLALAQKSDFDGALAAGDNAAARELRDSGQTLNLATDVLLISALVGAGVTTLLLIMDLGDDGSAGADDAPAPTTVRLVPSFAVPGGGVAELGGTLTGAF